MGWHADSSRLSDVNRTHSLALWQWRRSASVTLNSNMGGRNLLERLREGVVLGDGSYAMTLEKRGYVTCGPFTPEAVLQNPEAVKQLSREFARAGADIVQAYSFYASDSKLEVSGVKYDSEDLNHVACEIAREIAEENDCLVVGGVSPTPTYVHSKDKAAVQKEFQKQVDIFVRNKVDFVLAEFFIYIEELEWAIEVMKSSGLPVAANMRIGPVCGDATGVSPGQCAVRMANAGADIVGVNCNFDPKSSLQTLRIMKDALEEANLHPYLMAQPVGFHCLESVDAVDGYMMLPEFPLALEPRLITRWDARQFAREAYDLGVRYIGGCCGFEPYHIREMAEELAEERGKRPPGKDKNGHWGSTLATSVFPFVRARQGKGYWSGLKLATGRETSCYSSPAVNTIHNKHTNEK